MPLKRRLHHRFPGYGQFRKPRQTENARIPIAEQIMTKFAPFDAADYLTNEETIAEYLAAALEDPNPDMILVALRDVARSLGINLSAAPAHA